MMTASLVSRDHAALEQLVGDGGSDTVHEFITHVCVAVQHLDGPLLRRLFPTGGPLPTFSGELLARRVLLLFNDVLREPVQQRILLGVRGALSNARQAEGPCNPAELSHRYFLLRRMQPVGFGKPPWFANGRAAGLAKNLVVGRAVMHGYLGDYFELVADPSAIHESAPLLHALGRTIAAPALGMRAWCDFVRMVRLGSVSLPCVFVVGCRSVGADAALSISGRAAFGGICLLCSQEKKQGDH
jgi:hypothetical protein